MPVPASNHGPITALKPSDEQVLRSLHRFHYLSSRQLCRLAYSRGSLTYAQSKLKKLTDAGYCQRIWVPKRAQYGSAPSVYALARRGINHLRAIGLDLNGRFHPSEKRSLSYLFLNHVLELNDVLISAELLSRAMPQYRLAALRHDQDLKRTPVAVRTKSGGKAAVIPDAWLDLRIQERFQVCLAVELDRGTEEQKRWRQKVANLIAYAGGPYQEAFGTHSLTFAVITTAGDKRLLDLLRWTEAELESMGETSQGDLFLFTSLSPAAAESIEIFLARCWLQPFSQEPVALLESPD
ncbi:MAG: replication-relaxation family protein [Candidatus Obscuribacterales bacterium]